MNWLKQGLAIVLVAGVNASAMAAQVRLGVHVGSENDPNWQTELGGLEAQVGRTMAIDSDYDDWAAFPDLPRIKWDLQTGHLPMQNWRVPFQNSNPNACATAAAINAGAYDTQLAQQAAAVKSVGGVVLVRFNWEMTNNSYNTCFTGFPVSQNIPLAGQEYIAAWKHVVDRFRAAGASNVRWVWAPGAPAYYQGIWSYFYPGAAYVDWIAVDAYNMADSLESFGNAPGIPDFDAAMTPFGKPMMISENGALNDPLMNPDPQTRWITSARTYLKQHPEITAYVYWDSSANQLPPPPYSGSGYYLVGPGLTAFTAMANDPYFGATGP